MTFPRFPHPLVLLVGFIALAAVLTHVLPAGEFERRMDRRNVLLDQVLDGRIQQRAARVDVHAV